MATHPPHRWLVPFDGSFRLRDVPTSPPDDVGRAKDWMAALARHQARIGDRQRVLSALDMHAVLCVFQGTDTAGKGGTIRKVFQDVEPAGVHVHAFGAPSTEEIEHDFLWRAQLKLPQRGQIAVFDRSHYEEVIVTRVHPELLERQKLRSRSMHEDLWPKRFKAIVDWEHHLADSGVVVLKFFLHLGRDEQRRRLLSRIDRPEKSWKFDFVDVEERRRWPDFQHAYQEALAATSRPHAPWYAIPADDKKYARAVVAEIVASALDGLDLHWPVPDKARKKRLAAIREALEDER
jgi:PPK2 family polyphosphate:nucleotide phosphotransferase